VCAVVSNVFVGVIAGVQADSDPQGKAYKSNCDRLDHFLREVKAPYRLKRRMREHLRLSRDLVARQSFSDLLDFFPPKLRGAVNAHVGGATLRAVPYLRACEPAFIVQLSERLAHAGYEAGETIAHDAPAICFVTRGTAVRGGHPIVAGEYWGEDAVISSHALRNARPALALTYCETATYMLARTLTRAIRTTSTHPFDAPLSDRAALASVRPQGDAPRRRGVPRGVRGVGARDTAARDGDHDAPRRADHRAARQEHA
jgi:hypothetical protein